MLFNLAVHRYVSRCTMGFSRFLAKDVFFNKYTPIKKGQALVTLSFDIDFERDVLALPAAMDVLERFNFKGSFACIGLWAKKYSDIHRAIVDSGHEILNHSYSHPDNEELNLKRFSYLSFEEQKREIELGHEELVEILQCEISGFRTPHFGNQHIYNVYQILKELKYKFSSSMLTANSIGLSNVMVEKETGVLEIPVATVPGMPWASFDSWNYFNRPRPLHLNGRSMVRDFNNMLEKALIEGDYINVYFDPADFISRPQYQEICMLLQKLGTECRVVTYKDIITDLE